MKTLCRYLLLALLLAAGAAAADAPSTASPSAPLKVEKFRLGPWEDEIGYRQAVRVGNVLYISGTPGMGDMPFAMRKVYSTLRRTLVHYGLGFPQVVKETIYTTNLEALKANAAIRKEFYGPDFPAATWVQVARLYDPEDVIEVELTAAFPN